MLDHLLKEAVYLIYHVINKTRVHAKKKGNPERWKKIIIFSFDLKAKINYIN